MTAMNDRTLVERLRAASANMREHYSSGAVELIPTWTMDEAATRIEALEAALRSAPELHEYGSKREIAELTGVGRSFVDAWRNWLITARKALESKP